MPASAEAQENAVTKAASIFRLIKLAAENGLECPTNAALAEAVGYRSTANVAKALSFLAVAGMIEIERFNHTRIVTIVASGKKTAGAIRKPHHSAKINAVRSIAA